MVFSKSHITMSNINIFVSDVNDDDTDFRFFIDASGNHELLPKNILFLNNTYTFEFLNNNNNNFDFVINKIHNIEISNSNNNEQILKKNDTMTIKFTGITEHETLSYSNSFYNPLINGNFNLIRPSAVFNKSVQFKDIIDVSGRSILHGGVTSYGQVAVGKANADISFAVDVSGLVNCSDLLINGTEPSYVGGKYIKHYNDKIPTNKFTETYEESVKHHSTWTTDPSHITYVVGNVGIGTLYPDASYSLDVSGTVKIDNNLTIGDVEIQDLNTVLDVSGLSVLTGPLGIGIREPSGEFLMDVSGDTLIRGDVFTQGSMGVGIENADTSYVLDVSGAVKMNQNLSIGTTHALDVSTALDVSGLTLLTGPVGIGTREPSGEFLMDVSGILNCTELYVNGEEPLFGTQNVKLYESDTNISASYETIENYQSWSATHDSVYYNLGNVGIGKSVIDTSYVLDVSGTVNCTKLHIDGIDIILQLRNLIIDLSNRVVDLEASLNNL